MKRLKFQPTLRNILTLFAKRLDTFSGESKRSYQKAFSSLQVFLVSNYSSSEQLTPDMIENWIIHNHIQGLSPKTISFYLDKVSSLHSGIANNLSTGSTDMFKEIKQRLRELNFEADNVLELKEIANSKIDNRDKLSPSNKYLWGCMALNAGIPAGYIRRILDDVPEKLGFLNLCRPRAITLEEQRCIEEKVKRSLEGEAAQWFAMRLRPKVKFEDVLTRISLTEKEFKNKNLSEKNFIIPEFFYPFEEIARRVGRKLVWKGRPVIRDVVFFKTRKSDIYPLFTQLYDLAWCYRTPGGKTLDYSAIPPRAMEEFRKALGILTPDFEVAPAGELKLKPGDKVVILQGDYEGSFAEILRAAHPDENSNTVYRVSLLNSNSRWDIGVDARLLKKQESK